jgi:hypothetical protein
MAEREIRSKIRNGFESLWIDHSGKIVVGGVALAFFTVIASAQLLQNEIDSNKDEKDRIQEETAQRITSELEDDGFEASSFSATKTAAKLIIGDCIVETDFSAVGGGWNGLDELEDITSYTVTQKTNDGKVTRVTEFENFSDLQSQTDDNPCAYFFVD